jgi:diphthamide biosynthesis protein 2
VDERRGSDENDGDDEDGENDSNRPVFSLVTGTYRHPKRYGGGGDLFLGSHFLN